MFGEFDSTDGYRLAAIKHLVHHPLYDMRLNETFRESYQFHPHILLCLLADMQRGPERK